MADRKICKLSPDAGCSTSAVPIGPVLNIDAKKIENLARSEAAGAEMKSASSSSSTTLGQFDERRIYVSNIPFSFRGPDLVQMFSPFGVVSNAEIVMNERGSKGFGFVTLDTKEGCEAARAALNGMVVQGRVIEVKKATTAPHRRNAARVQHASVLPQTAIAQAPRVDLLAGQLPQLQANPLITHNLSDPLMAALLAQNQLRLQAMINPLAMREHSLLYPRTLPIQQPGTLMNGGVQLPFTISPIPFQLLCTAPSQGIENLPPNVLTTTMMPLGAPGLTYATLPTVNPNNVLIPPTMQGRFPQEATNEGFANYLCDSGLFKTPASINPYTGYLDLVGSLGLTNDLSSQIRAANAKTVKDNFRKSSLRAFDQSCVIDTSFHGEPLKEGQFGPIGRAVPAGGVSNQANSSSNDFRSQSMALEENALECNAGQSGANNPSSLPVYHPFESSTDRNGRKRLSSLDSYHQSKKQAKSN
ncbi:hypothetical protein V3C99_011807 [Haemonchus contortus]